MHFEVLFHLKPFDTATRSLVKLDLKNQLSAVYQIIRPAGNSLKLLFKHLSTAAVAAAFLLLRTYVVKFHPKNKKRLYVIKLSIVVSSVFIPRVQKRKRKLGTWKTPFQIEIHHKR